MERVLTMFTKERRIQLKCLLAPRKNGTKCVGKILGLTFLISSIGCVAWSNTASAELSIKVDIAAQKLYVYDDYNLVAESPVSTGRKGHRTPKGSFYVLYKQQLAHSKKYDNAPMPYLLMVTEDGVGIHAGKLPGYPASHGCIRLPLKFAKELWYMIPSGTTVEIE
jgi:lipoprotein-anchoring transpeptidase ErfK/SrfK